MYISGQTKAGAVCVLSVSGFRLHDPIRILNLNLADLRFARLPTRAASRGFKSLGAGIVRVYLEVHA